MDRTSTTPDHLPRRTRRAAVVAVVSAVAVLASAEGADAAPLQNVKTPASCPAIGGVDTNWHLRIENNRATTLNGTITVIKGGQLVLDKGSYSVPAGETKPIDYPISDVEDRTVVIKADGETDENRIGVDCIQNTTTSSTPESTTSSSTPNSSTSTSTSTTQPTTTSSSTSTSTTRPTTTSSSTSTSSTSPSTTRPTTIPSSTSTSSTSPSTTRPTGSTQATQPSTLVANPNAATFQDPNPTFSGDVIYGPAPGQAAFDQQPQSSVDTAPPVPKVLARTE